MIKTRVIPCLLMTELVLVKTVKFGEYRPIGIPQVAVRIFNAREVDELILLDIHATPECRGPSLELIADLTEACQMPLTVGGGIRDVQDARRLLKAGADKVAVNTEAVRHPELLTELAATFGSQSVVLAMDVRVSQAGQSEVYVRGGTEATGLDPVVWAQRAEQLGAGELLVTSIDQDGTMAGYAVDLIRRVADAVRLPVIACGGAGRLEDFVDAVLHGHASAVAAASIFFYTQTTPKQVKQALADAGVQVRI